jgi:hypothetical protein
LSFIFEIAQLLNLQIVTKILWYNIELENFMFHFRISLFPLQKQAHFTLLALVNSVGLKLTEEKGYYLLNRWQEGYASTQLHSLLKGGKNENDKDHK